MADTPGRFDITLDGVGYQLFEDGEQPALVHQSIRTQREQSGGANANIGEATVNPEGFWRRSRDGWHAGAGQSYADRDESNPLRFRASVGVDVFSTRHQLSLLPTVTSRLYTPAGGVFSVQSAGDLYIRDGNGTVKRVDDPTTTPWTPTTLTGTPTGTASEPDHRSMASDGATLYIAFGADGIYTASTTTASSFITGAVSRVWWAKGRLIAALAQFLYNPVAAGALPSALHTLPFGGEWVDVCEGPNHIYLLATDSSFQRGTIYKTTVKADGTALDVPTVAGELDLGERATAIACRAGYAFITTSKTVRAAKIDENGNLEMGSTVAITGNKNRNAIFGLGRFVYFGGLNSAGGGYGGLGKMDLSTFILPNTFAYANDIVVPSIASDTTNNINAITRFVDSSGNDRLVITVRGDGIYLQSTSYVTEGYVDSGLLALDLADPKTPVAIDVEGGALDASETITEAVSVDRGATFTDVATWNSQTDGEMAVTGVAAARQFELRTTLEGDGAATPVLYRHTLKAEPNVNQSDYIIARLSLFESIVDNTGSAVGRDPSALRAALRALQQSREVVTLVEGDVSYSVTVRDMDDQYMARTASADDGDWNSVATIRMKVIA